MEPGNYGTAGIVSLEPTKDSRNERSQVRWIKAGFDNEFNPMLMLLDSRSDHHKSVGTQFWLDKPYQPEAGILSTLIGGFDWRAHGVCLLNSSCTLSALNLRIDTSLLPDSRPTMKAKADADTRGAISTIDFTALNDCSQESAHHHEQHEVGALCCC